MSAGEEAPPSLDREQWRGPARGVDVGPIAARVPCALATQPPRGARLRHGRSLGALVAPGGPQRRSPRAERFVQEARRLAEKEGFVLTCLVAVDPELVRLRGTGFPGAVTSYSRKAETVASSSAGAP